MMVDLESRLRVELTRDALRAPMPAPEWSEVAVRPLTARQRPRPLLRIVSIAAAALLVVGAAAVIAFHEDAPLATGFVPSGEEFPLVDEFPLTQPTPASLPDDWTAVARPGSALFASSPDLDGWLATFETVDYDYTSGALAQWTCLAMSAPQATFGMICPVDGSGSGSGGDASGGRSQWVNVPPGTAVVGYTDGLGKTWWQRPIGRLAMFPLSASDGTFSAFSDDGTVLQTFAPAIELDMSVDVTEPVLNSATAMEDSLTDDQRANLRHVVRDDMRNCVEAAGATYPNGPMFPEGDPAAWDHCVDTVRIEVAHQFTAFGGHLVPHQDPTASTNQP